MGNVNNKLVSTAVDLIQKGDAASAINFLNKYLKSNPEDIQASITLARAYRAANLHAEAAQHLINSIVPQTQPQKSTSTEFVDTDDFGQADIDYIQAQGKHTQELEFVFDDENNREESPTETTLSLKEKSNSVPSERLKQLELRNQGNSDYSLNETSQQPVIRFKKPRTKSIELESTPVVPATTLAESQIKQIEISDESLDGDIRSSTQQALKNIEAEIPVNSNSPPQEIANGSLENKIEPKGKPESFATDDISSDVDDEWLTDEFSSATNENVYSDDLEQYADLDDYSDDISHTEVTPDITPPAEKGRVSRKERANQIAVELAAEYDWGKNDVPLLEEIFIAHGWSACRAAIERQLQKGLTPEELELAFEFKKYWAESSQFWTNHFYIRDYHVKKQATATFSTVSWIDSLKLVRLYTGLPDIEELYIFVDDAYAVWSINRRFRNEYPAFLHYFVNQLRRVPGGIASNVCHSPIDEEHIPEGEFGFLGNSNFPNNNLLFELGISINDWQNRPDINTVSIAE